MATDIGKSGTPFDRGAAKASERARILEIIHWFEAGFEEAVEFEGRTSLLARVAA